MLHKIHHIAVIGCVHIIYGFKRFYKMVILRNSCSFIFRTNCLVKLSACPLWSLRGYVWEDCTRSYYFLDDDSGKCRCNFCPIDIIQLFIYPKRMTYFLEYTGCEDIFSLKITHSVNGIAHC